MESATIPARPRRSSRRAAIASLIADPRLPVALFAAAVAVSGVLLVALNAQLTFYVDDWEVLLHRRGFNFDDFMIPHAGHPSMSLVAVYKVIQATLGMDSLTPYAIASTLVFLASVVLLFVWMRSRVGDWLAFAGTLPLLFLGTAFEDLLTPFQIGYFAPMACGIGALLVLERGGRRTDFACCLLLVLAISFQTVGLVFAVGAGVAIFLEGDLRRRGWVAIVPMLLYGLWYLGYGDSDANQLSFENLATSPAFIVDGYASSLSSLLGLSNARDQVLIGSLDWGRPLLALALVVGAARLIALGRVPKWLWVVLAAGAGFWFLTALNASVFRAATSSRYQYIGAIFVLMAAAELARGFRPSARLIAIAVAIAVAATASNLSTLHNVYLGLKGAAPIVRGDLAGLEIAADRVDPGFVLTPDNSDFNYFTLVDAGSYLSASAAFGSPAYSTAELESAPEQGRVAADKVLAAALPARLVPLPPGTSVDGCQTATAQVELPVGGAVIRAPAGASVEVVLRRYAQGSFPVTVGSLDAGAAATLSIPDDASSKPWQAELRSWGRSSVCPLAP
jgi:hypothetical protein